MGRKSHVILHIGTIDYGRFSRGVRHSHIVANRVTFGTLQGSTRLLAIVDNVGLDHLVYSAPPIHELLTVRLLLHHYFIKIHI